MLLTSYANWIAFAIIVGATWALPFRWRSRWLAGSSMALLALNDFVAAIILLLVGAFALIGPHYVNWAASGRGRRLWTAAIVLLSPLLFFKYVGTAGLVPSLDRLGGVALPTGISYFTLKALMFLIDRSHRKLAEPRFDEFVAFLALAPTLSAGPIDPPSRLVPALVHSRRPDAAGFSYGLVRIVIGSVMKFVVADSILRIIGESFRPESLALSTSKLVLFGPLYSLLIYFDFAGYSHMAIGAAALLGLRVTENFAAPYRQPNISEFWRSWHMSLTDFLRRYVFLPLAHRAARLVTPHTAAYGATIATFVLCGMWHGTGWHYACWGLYHGMLLSAHQMYANWARRRRRIQSIRRARWFRLVATAGTFCLVSAGWYLFAFDARQLGVIFGFVG